MSRRPRRRRGPRRGAVARRARRRGSPDGERPRRGAEPDGRGADHRRAGAGGRAPRARHRDAAHAQAPGLGAGGRVSGRRLRAAVAAALAAALVPAAASAPAFLVTSAPASRATLGRAPDRVQLWFNERLEPAYSSISVWDAAGAQVDARNGGVSADDPRRLELPLPPLGPGRYVVRFRVLSVDGHVVESSLPF